MVEVDVGGVAQQLDGVAVSVGRYASSISARPGMPARRRYVDEDSCC